MRSWDPTLTPHETPRSRPMGPFTGHRYVCASATSAYRYTTAQTAHLLHAFAPAAAPVFVTEPAGQVSQSFASSEPVDSMYLPASQSMQAATFDAVEYLPTAQALQVVAPVLVPVSVIDPAVHTVHAATFDAVEYVPAAHAEHKLAPACAPVLVIEPATHALQWPCPMSSWY